VAIGPKNGSAGDYSLPGSPFSASRSGSNYWVVVSGLQHGTYRYEIRMTDACGVVRTFGEYVADVD
jgi:hypothetical protein